MHCHYKQDLGGEWGHFCAPQVMPFRQPRRCTTSEAAGRLRTQWSWALKDARALKHLFTPQVSLNQSQIWQCHTHSQNRLPHVCLIVYIVHFFKERNGSVNVVFMIKDPKLEIEMHSSQSGETDECMYLLDGKKTLSILSKLLLGWLHPMPSNKINKKFYSNNPPCSEKLRKRGSFLLYGPLVI